MFSDLKNCIARERRQPMLLVRMSPHECLLLPCSKATRTTFLGFRTLYTAGDTRHAGPQYQNDTFYSFSLSPFPPPTFSFLEIIRSESFGSIQKCLFFVSPLFVILSTCMMLYEAYYITVDTLHSGSGIFSIPLALPRPVTLDYNPLYFRFQFSSFHVLSSLVDATYFLIKETPRPQQSEHTGPVLPLPR